MEQQLPQANKKSNSKNVVNLQKGKIPPQAVQLEEAVLGALLIDKKGLDDVIDILKPEAFYKSAHQAIFKAIVTLFNDSKPTDLLTVANQLKLDGKLEFAGGDYYLIQLSQRVASSAHVEYHARIILQKYLQRQLIALSSEIIEDAYDETTDVFNLLDKAETKLFEVTQGNLKKNSEDASSLVRQALEKIEEISNKDGLSGLQTGFMVLQN